MGKFITKKAASAVVLLFGLMTIIFVIAHAAPGDPVSAMISPKTPASVGQELRHQFGLDQSVFLQYLRWLENALKGNFGFSFSYQRPVVDVLMSFFPNTALLALSAIGLEIILGVALGILAVSYQNSWLDRIINNASLVAYTLPTFWVGLMFLALFSYALGLFPSSQMNSVEAEQLSVAGRCLDLVKHLILPVLTIAVSGAAGIARYFRASLLTVQNAEYVTYARSLGIKKRDIFLFYELPNSIAPVITILGLEIGTLLAGAVVTETIFAWPGIGRLAVLAMLSRDYPLILGCTLVSGIVVIVGNLIADLLYMYVDPRIRLPV